MFRNDFELVSASVDIYQAPPRDEDHLAKEGWQLTIGDLHANTITLIYMLRRHGIIQDLNDTDYATLVKIYRTERSKTESNDLKNFIAILSRLSFNKTAMIRLLGNEMASKGNNDYLTLAALKRLREENIATEILLSNHSFELIKAYETYQRTKNEKAFLETTLATENAKSLLTLGNLIKKKMIDVRTVLEMIETGYNPSLKVLSYGLSMDKKDITLFSHAPIDIRVIESLARKLGQTFDDENAIALAETIDKINSEFQKRVTANKVSGLIDDNIVQAATFKGDTISHEVHPFEYIMCNQKIDLLDRQENHKGYRLNFVHGHVAPSNQALPNVTPLYSNLGKAYLKHGEYLALYTHQHPAKPNQDTKALAARSAKDEAERKKRAEDERAAKEKAENEKRLAAERARVEKEKTESEKKLADERATSEKSKLKISEKPQSTQQVIPVKSDEELANEAHANFSSCLNRGKNASLIDKAGLELLDAVYECKTITDDYRKRLLIAAKNLHSEPANSDHQKTYTKILNENTDGKGSKFKFFLGIGLIFLGAALIAASIALGITTFGMASPLTIGGIVLGVSCIVNGGLLCAAGARKGLDKALTNYQNIATNKSLLFSHKNGNKKTDSNSLLMSSEQTY